MGFFRNLFKGTQPPDEVLMQKNTEEMMAFQSALFLMNTEFPGKFPKPLKEFTGMVLKDTIEIVANLKIKSDEVYEREIITNDKPHKYKIILKKDRIEDYEKTNSFDNDFECS